MFKPTQTTSRLIKNNHGFLILIIPLLALILMATLFYTTKRYYPDIFKRSLDAVSEQVPDVIKEPDHDITPNQKEIEQAMQIVLTDKRMIKRFGLSIEADKTYLIKLSNGGSYLAKSAFIKNDTITFTDKSGMQIEIHLDGIRSISKLSR